MKALVLTLVMTLLPAVALAQETVKFTDLIGKKIDEDTSCSWKKVGTNSGYGQYGCASFPGPSDFNGVMAIALTEEDGTIVAVSGVKEMDSDLVESRYTSLGAHFEKKCEKKEHNLYNATFDCGDEPDVHISYDYSDGITLMYMESIEKLLNQHREASAKENEGL